MVILLLMCICIPTFARNRVKLRGQLSTKQRSESTDIPVKAEIEESSKTLYLEFLSNLGELSISVVDSNGNIVYNNVVNTQIPIYTIALDNVFSGSYKLYLVQSENYVEGDFEL